MLILSGTSWAIIAPVCTAAVTVSIWAVIVPVRASVVAIPIDSAPSSAPVAVPACILPLHPFAATVRTDRRGLGQGLSGPHEKGAPCCHDQHSFHNRLSLKISGDVRAGRYPRRSFLMDVRDRRMCCATLLRAHEQRFETT